MIRTYKRRAPECVLIEGVAGRCRLCLGSQPSMPIYGENSWCSPLASRITMCIGLKMTKDNDLPNYICAECYKQIETCYAFRKLCEVAYQKLKMHLQAVKMKKANELLDEANRQTRILQKSLETRAQDNGSLIRDLKNNTVNLPLKNIKAEPENIVNAQCAKKENEMYMQDNTENEMYLYMQENAENVVEIQHENKENMVTAQCENNEDIVNAQCAHNEDMVNVQCAENKDMANVQCADNEDMVNVQCAENKDMVNVQCADNEDMVNVQCANNGDLVNAQCANNEDLVNAPCANKHYVDLVLVINEDNVKLLEENNIDQNKLMELYGPAGQHNGLKVNGESLQQAAMNNGDFENQELSQPGVPQEPHPSSSQEPAEAPNLATEPSISSFIITELLDSQMLRVQSGGLLAVNEGVEMVVEMMTRDGSLVTLDLMEEELGQPSQPKDPLIIYESVSKASSADFLTIKSIESLAAPPGGRKKRRPKSKAKDHTCEVCEKTFPRRGALQRHYLVHSGARPFHCRHCSRAFAQRSVCKRHEHTHEATRPFPCPMCPKGFTQRSALQTHLRSHQPPSARSLTLHACEQCPKMFLYASGLTRHMKIHAGLKFVCQSCSRPFNDKSSLRRHTAKHVGDSALSTTRAR